MKYIRAASCVYHCLNKFILAACDVCKNLDFEGLWQPLLRTRAADWEEDGGWRGCHPWDHHGPIFSPC